MLRKARSIVDSYCCWVIIEVWFSAQVGWLSNCRAQTPHEQSFCYNYDQWLTAT